MGRVIKAAEIRRTEAAPGSPPEGPPVDRAEPVDGNRLKRLAMDLAEEMAARIIGDAVDSDPARLETIYRRAVTALGLRSGARITVHPADRQLVEIETLGAPDTCRVDTDPAVGRGGYRIHTGVGEIDGAIDTLLKTLREATGVDR